MQDQLFYLAKPCVDSALSDEIGEIIDEDYERAEISQYDFGEHAVPYKQLLDKFPNLDTPVEYHSTRNIKTLQV